MGVAIHRTTKDIRVGNSPDFAPADWFLMLGGDPGLTDLTNLGFKPQGNRYVPTTLPNRHVKIVEPNLVEMTPVEKLVVDTALLAQLKPIYQANVFDSYNTYLDSRYVPPLREAYVHFRSASGNNAAQNTLLTAYFNWVKDVLIYANTLQQSIAAAATLNDLNAIVIDFPGNLDASDPGLGPNALITAV